MLFSYDKAPDIPNGMVDVRQIYGYVGGVVGLYPKKKRVHQNIRGIHFEKPSSFGQSSFFLLCHRLRA